MKNKPKNIPSLYKSKGTPIYRDTTALPFDNGGNMQDPPIVGSGLPPTYPFNYSYNFLNPNYKVVNQNPNAGTESMLNPMNWLVPRMDQETTFNDAFEKAKRSGHSEFIYNGQRYNTKSNMTPDQQMQVYGITDDRRILDPSQVRKNLSTLNTEEGYSGGAQAAVSRMLGMSPGLNFAANEGNAPGAKEQDAFKLYLGLPQSYNTFKPSKYKQGALELTDYNKLLPDTMPSDEDIKKYGVPEYSDTWKKGNPLKPYDDYVMGRHTVKKGKDSKGEYIEYIDKWDLDTFGKAGEFADYLNQPFDIYGRKYYKDYGDGVKKTMYYSDQELQSFDPKNKNFDALALQKELANRGYKFPKSTTKSGEFDGVYGEETKKALQDWQSKNFKSGEIYTFSERPGSYYKYTEEGDMLIKNKNTGGKYIPMTDEEGKRLKTLQAGLATGKTKKFLDGGPLVDKTNHGDLLPSVYASALGNYYAQGGMIKRADGSYSPRGLWDNIRAAAAKNKAAGKPGKEPSKEILAEAKKIEAEEKEMGGYLYARGGQFPRPYSLPEDSFKQGGDNLHNSVYASSMAQYPAVYKYGGSFDMPRQQMYMPLDNVERYGGNMYREGGSVFYATNTPQLEGEGKDLTYPENAYIYASGGLINNYNTGGAMNFKSKGAYQKWLAYGHASGEFAKTPGNQPVSIGGKSHKVEHGYGGHMYAAGGSFNNPGFNALPVEVQNKIRANSFEAGGTMDQLTEFNAGGTHEENPLGGIPQGMAPDGRLNLVEQGETKLKETAEGGGNFVYSDSITVDREFAETYHLPNTYIGKTYAEASKLANRPKSRRENDTIEQTDIKRKLDSLAQAQEAQKAKIQQEETAQQLAANPQLLDALMGQLAANQSVQPMGMPQGEEVSPEEVPAEMLAQMPEAQQGMPIMRLGGNMYRCGGKMYDFGGWMGNNSGAISGAATGAMSGAATGSAFGPWGTIGGLVIGGFAGGVSGNKKDKEEQDAKDAAKQEQLAQGMEMQRMQDPTYVTPAAQYALNAGAGTGATYPYMAKQGGPLYHQYPPASTHWKNNAGPMGQGLANTQVYNMGGRMMADGGPGNPPYIASYTPTLPSDYAANYKTRYQEFKNNPIDPKTGVPMYGSGGQDAGSTGTGGDYRPVTAAERAARIKEFETFGPNDVQPGFLEEYLTLKNNAPYFVASSSPSKTIFAPYDLRKYTPPTAAQLAELYPPAPPAPESIGYARSANTGELMPGRSNVDNAGNRFIEDRQYSQYLEEAANDPAALAKKEATEMERVKNLNLIKQLSQEQLKEMKGMNITPMQYVETKGLNLLPFGQAEGVTFADGGTIETFNPALTSTVDSDFTRELKWGDFLKNKTTKPSITKTGTLTSEDYTAEDRAMDEITLKTLKSKIDSGEELTEAEMGEYQSVLQRLNEDLDTQDTDFGIKVKPAELAAMGLPVAYNVGRGLFGKVEQLNPEDYMINRELTPYQYNITPELREIGYSEGNVKDAIRNAGLSGGAYATNMQNVYNTSAELKGQAYAKKQNIDAQNYMAAQQANMALDQQNMASRMGIIDWNTKAKAAKALTLQEGLKQAADIGKTFVDMKGQQALVKAYAPDYAETLKLLLAKKEKATKPATGTEETGTEGK